MHASPFVDNLRLMSHVSCLMSRVMPHASCLRYRDTMFSSLHKRNDEFRKAEAHRSVAAALASAQDPSQYKDMPALDSDDSEDGKDGTGENDDVG